MTSCCDLLIAEHRQTEALLASLEVALTRACGPEGLDATGWIALEKEYRHLAEDLYRHFVLEERALFSLLSQYRTMMLMEVEHDDLLTLQGHFEDPFALSRSNNKPEANLLSSFLAFKTRLLAHIVEEERGIFPLANACLEPEEQEKARRVYHGVQAAFQESPVLLHRELPCYQIRQTALFQTLEKPLTYETLYDREYTSVQHLQIKAGTSQKLHWVGQHQCLILISGEATLETPAEKIPLAPGQSVSIDSRLYFALHALTDTHLLAFKVWPHPHYTKAH